MSINAVNLSTASVAASQTGQPVSKPIVLKDRFNASIHVELSAVVEAADISFELQDSYDGQTWYPVGSESKVSVAGKTATLGVAEKNTITAPAESAVTQGDYFIHHTPTRSIAVWLDVDDDGTVPTGTNFEATDAQIEVDIAEDDADTVVATKIRAVLAEEDDLIITGATNAVIIENVETGAADNATRSNAAEDGNGSFAVATTTAGSDGAVTLATNAITITTHGFSENQKVYVRSTGSMPGGSATGVYFVNVVDTNTIKLKETFDGSVVDLTDFGSGTLSTTPATLHIRMIFDDSSDKAQLPFEDMVRVVCTTGSGDSCTVSGVFVADNA